MVERRRIVDLAIRHQSERGVLITLVRAAGSSYRKPGARMLVVGQEFAGTISGGCLEAEVVRKAEWTVRGGAAVKQYSTALDDTSDIPYGLGCGGTVDLLFEPSGTPEFAAVLSAMQRSLDGLPSDIATILPEPGKPLQRVVECGGELVFCSDTRRGTHSDTRSDTRSDGPGDRPSHMPSVLTLEAARAGGMENLFLERMAAPQRLVLFGAGDDAQPLVRMAHLLGWSVTVVDGRRQLARADRFPEALRVIALPAGDVAPIAITPEDAVVLMTHSFEQDLAWLSATLPLAPRYLGVLGARQRSGLLVREASAITDISIPQCCERIHAPVGLDLGGDGPEAIALAVMAEAQACCMGRPASSRRLSSTDVQSHLSRADVSGYTQAGCALGREAA
jgi:xanthine/CO dehydrogenase XdhC/CoxF family maturation factor